MSETDRILNDVRDYVRISAVQAVKPIAIKVIDSYEKAQVYGALDGSTLLKKIQEMTKIADSTISDWLAIFVRSQLCTQPNEFYKSHRALFSLQELGIDSSVLKKRAKIATKNQSTTQATSDTQQTGGSS